MPSWHQKKKKVIAKNKEVIVKKREVIAKKKNVIATDIDQNPDAAKKQPSIIEKQRLINIINLVFIKQSVCGF